MKSVLSKIFSALFCILLVFGTCTTAFATEETFVSDPNSVIIAVASKGEGEVSGSGMYQKGDEVTLTAVPDKDRAFIGWYDSKKNLLSTELILNFTADENRLITAEFESKTAEEQKAETESVKNKNNAKRQAIWITSIIAVSAIVVFLVVIVEKKRMKEE